MQFRGLMAFRYAARHLSFKDAAEEFGVTPSAVSHQIEDLEAFLGVELFERQTRTIVLTETGRTYFEDIEPLMRSIEVATARVRKRAPRTLLTFRCRNFSRANFSFLASMNSRHGTKTSICVSSRWGRATQSALEI